MYSFVYAQRHMETVAQLLENLTEFRSGLGLELMIVSWLHYYTSSSGLPVTSLGIAGRGEEEWGEGQCGILRAACAGISS